MYLPSDPVVLVSVINTRLRDFYDSLSALCNAEDIDCDELLEKLSAAGYHYEESQNQFR